MLVAIQKQEKSALDENFIGLLVKEILQIKVPSCVFQV